MLQTFIATVIVMLAAVLVLKIAYSRINSSQKGGASCGCGCSGCNPAAADKTGCDVQKN